MSYEVNNLAGPYTGVARVYVWFSYDDYQLDVASNFSTFHGATGSGVFIGGNDVLTASHVVYDAINNRVPYRIEVVPGLDTNYPASGAAEVPFGTFRADKVAYFDNFDPNHDGYILPGDATAGSLGGSELDVAILDLSIINSAPTPAPMRMDTTFNSGSLRLTGYPASANGNPMEEIVSANRYGSDNSFLVNGTLGPGSSGGPAWNYVNGTASVFGVVSSTGAVAGLAPHANWIADFTRLNDDNIVYTSANDIIRPYIREFSLNKPAGFSIGEPYQYLEGSTRFFGLTLDGGSGIDTIAVPFHSQTGVFSDARLNYSNSNAETGVYFTWSKAANGIISGDIHAGSVVHHFSNVERLAFSDVVYDLTQSVVGTQYVAGPGAGTAVVTGTVNGTNPVVFRIQSVAGDDAKSDQLYGSTDPDQMFGLAGDDLLVGSLADDSLDGGNGSDTVDYSFATQTVVVDLPSNVALGAEIGTDTLANMENVKTGSGNDAVAGDGNINVLDGGAGIDTVSYYKVTSGVVLDLAAQVGVDGTSRDTLLNFENANGTRYDDAMSGTAAANVLNGLAGIDTISYYKASQGVTIDLYAGVAVDGSSRDTLLNFENVNGSAHNDTIAGDAGANVLNGLGGTDTVSYYASAQAVTINLATGTAVSGGVADTLLNFENVNGSRHADNITGDGGANILNGLGGADILNGGGGDDAFVFNATQANGDVITDFVGNGAGAGDTLRFVGFGTAAQGATFTQLDGTHWQIHSGLDGHNEILTFSNAAGVHVSDVFLV
jgi:hypothetical protein